LAERAEGLRCRPGALLDGHQRRQGPGRAPDEGPHFGQYGPQDRRREGISWADFEVPNSPAVKDGMLGAEGAGLLLFGRRGPRQEEEIPGIKARWRPESGIRLHMAFTVNGELVEDSVVRAEVSALRPRYEEVARNMDPIEAEMQLREWSREN